MRVKTLYIILLVLAGVGALVGCGEEKDLYGVFYTDVVTCHTTGDTPYFTHQATDAVPLDTLYPVSALAFGHGQEGRRVMLQYRPIEQLSKHRKRIEVQTLSAIHFDTLKVVPHDTIAALPDDTIYLQSVWKTGDFLNLRYRVVYNSKPHSVYLVADESELSGDTLKVELRHSRNDDPEGHWRNLYSSFNISAYRSRPYTTLQLYVNQVNFDYKYYYFKLN